MFTRILKYPAETFVKLMTNRGFLVGCGDVIFIWIFVSGIFRLFPLFRAPCWCLIKCYFSSFFIFSFLLFFFFNSLPFAIKACSSTDGSLVFLRARERGRYFGNALKIVTSFSLRVEKIIRTWDWFVIDRFVRFITFTTINN